MSVCGNQGIIECDSMICQDIYVFCGTCVCEIDGNFAYTTTDSCTFSFTDLSVVDTCYDICSWNWDFGDGNTSTAMNPTHTYDTIGWVGVCLTVTACDTSVNPWELLCDTIFCRDVYVQCDTCVCEIDPDFSVATTDSCTFQFTDLSTVDTCYSLCDWLWTFGDGGTSTVQNPNYTYAASANGWQTVCLRVTACDTIDPASPTPLCDTLFCQEVYVGCDTCLCEIEPDFSFTTQDSCTYHFNDQSWVDTCFDICGWGWDFGDGNTSSLQNPSHTYTTTGWQTVCLTVTACDPFGILGCDTVFCQDIYVSCDTCECEIIPGFTYSVDHDSCSVSFTDQSHMADTCYNIWAWHWDFGDGNTSSNQNPTHTYSGTGWYTVCQTIYAGSPGSIDCDTTFCQDIYVDCDTCICDIDAAFSYTIDFDSCIVCFEDESTVDSCVEILGQSWDLGDGSASNMTSPCHSYSVNGIYTVCLTVSALGNNIQCDTTVCEEINIHCCDTTTGIGDWLDPDLEGLVFPNPFSYATNVRLSTQLKAGTVVLFDPLGRMVYQETFVGQNALIPAEGLSKGVYSLAILEKNRLIFRERVVIY